ncbi:hypothetical protein ACWGB8_14490 [Kitasatospora sp. NPDC054939]
MSADRASGSAGDLVFAASQRDRALDQQVKASRALRLAPGVYAVGADLPPETVAYIHRFSLIEHYWPGGVLCGPTAMSGGEPVDGYMFVAHAGQGRKTALKLPGLTVQPTAGPGPLASDESGPGGLWTSGTARRLLENVSQGKRPPRHQAGAEEVRQIIRDLADQGDEHVSQVSAEVEAVAEHFDPGVVAQVKVMLGSPMADEVPGASASNGGSASPYSTGGGGVTLERRLAAVYLSHLLTGTPVDELGASRSVTRVAFQQAPSYAVDDLVVTAVDPDNPQDSAELLIAARRAPLLTASDESSQQLITQVLKVTTQPTQPPPIRTVAVAVTGNHKPGQQLSLLAHHAHEQSDPDEFFALINEPRKFDAEVRGRLAQLLKLVAIGLDALSLPADEPASRAALFDLLSQLVVIQLRLEAPDEHDWGHLLGQLKPAARGTSPQGAARLRDRLEALAAIYAPAAAVIEASQLRRDVHALLESTYNRNAPAWNLLAQLDQDWRASIRSRIGDYDSGEQSVQIDRTADADLLRSAIDDNALLIHGQSGVGKSALICDLLPVGTHEQQILGLNLRHLPRTAVEFTEAMTVPLQQALAELSAPERILVIDGADAATESDAREDMLEHVLRAAHSAQVTPIVLTNDDALHVVRDITQRVVGKVRTHEVSGLDDAEIGAVARTFPHLRPLVESSPARELLRRPAITDLLVRAGTDGVPLTEADAMREIWHGLVRRGGRDGHGNPDARERVLRQLARQQLDRTDAETVLDQLDADAVAGLRRDGLLRPATDQPWQQVPSFTHDILRSYALAQLLLVNGRPGARLGTSQAPRWALPAARLACQALLTTSADRSDSPLAQRFLQLHEQFQSLVEAGYGDRWADIPSEALLTAGRDGDELSSAWPTILAAAPETPSRVLRVLGQRHQRGGLLDSSIAEPVIQCLLDHRVAPATAATTQEIIRDWQVALVFSRTPGGHPLRRRLREQLVQHCRAAFAALEEEQQRSRQQASANDPEKDSLAAAARLMAAPDMLRLERTREKRQHLPNEYTDEAMLERLALLGPDLDDETEEILRLVAEYGPHDLAPAVEKPFTGHALAQYSPELLRTLIEAYYIDTESPPFFSAGSDEGIREHLWGGLGTPLAASYRGPFLALLRTDFRRGVAVINTVLNAAAKARVAHMTRPTWHTHGQQADPRDFESIFVLDGAERCFIGDEQVWVWYRGTGVGPYPCMSALQALELVCDELIALGIQPSQLVPVMLAGAESLAMIGLIVGFLVRHVDTAGTLLDSFLAEPQVWHLEFWRHMSESSGLAARTPGIANVERRSWTLREATMVMVLSADEGRRQQLLAIGNQLVERAQEAIGSDAASVGTSGAPDTVDAETENFLATVRGWAATFDASRYRSEQQADGSVQIELTPPDDVVSVLQSQNDDLARGSRATALVARYGDRRKALADDSTPTDFLRDLREARDLHANPPQSIPTGPLEAPAAVACHALHTALVRAEPVVEGDLLWSANVLLEVAERPRSQEQPDDDVSLITWGADRSAARGLPLLLLPQAAVVRRAAGLEDQQGRQRLRDALQQLATAPAHESRLYYAGALDPVWAAPCALDSAEVCHHRVALGLVEDCVRAATHGSWNVEEQSYERLRLEGPVADALPSIPGDKIIVRVLSPGIRAAAPAAVSGCCSAEAARLLAALLDAHRRGLISHEHLYHRSQDDALVAARALLTVSDASAMSQHLAAYGTRMDPLAGFLRAVAAAAEETTTLADAASRAWPRVMDTVLGILDAADKPDMRDRYTVYATAALVPSVAYDFGYLYREVSGEPRSWTDLSAWTVQIGRWLTHASGHPDCVNALVSAVRTLPMPEQVVVGLPWMEALIVSAPDRIANRSWGLADWLREVRSHVHGNAPSSWQRIVDALTVAGDETMSDLAD